MLGTYSYHEIFRRTVVAFGTLFNNIELRRSTEVMKVPLAYGPKQKFLARLDQVPDPTNKRVQITLPRISFEINGIQYDSSRKVSPTQKIKFAKDADENKNAFMPVPYNLSFELAIIYTLQFTVKTYLYGPVTDSKTIKKVITDFYTDTNTTSAPREVRYTIQPDPVTADADDDFGFGIVDEDFSDNKKRNPTSGADEAI